MNLAILLGNVGRDPEIRYAQSGTAVVNFTLATNKKVNGEDKTSWHRCVVFGKTAEIIEQYVKKGSKIGVEGEISYGSYDKDGTTVYTTDIIVNRFHFAGEKAQSHPKQQPNQAQSQGHQGQGPIPDDDIPF